MELVCVFQRFWFKNNMLLMHFIKVFIAISLSLMFTIPLLKLVVFLWKIYAFNSSSFDLEVDIWLHENNFTQYKELFIQKGKLCCVTRTMISSCWTGRKSYHNMTLSFGWIDKVGHKCSYTNT